MAMPPKKKFTTKPSKVQQAAAEQAAMKKVINISIVLLFLPAIFFGVKQVNPGIFYKGQGIVMEKFQSHDGAARAFESAYKANPEKNIDGLVEACRLHEYLENWDAVEDIALQIIEAPGASAEQIGHANLYLAWRAFSQERYDDALALAEAAQKGISKSKEGQYRVWIAIGAIQTKRFAGDDNQLNKAYDALDTAIDMKKLFASEAHYYMGQLYEGWKSQTADAIEEYEYGLSQSPSPKWRKRLQDAKSRLVTGGTR